jgi:hypothetical protein
MTYSTQEDNYKYFLENKDKLLKEYPSKFLVIKNKEVIGVYDDQVTAYTDASKDNKPESFIVQQANAESTDVQVFHSRVISV